MANSNKLRASLGSDEKEMSVDMSPMIDMVFLLLIFFLVTANMIVVKQDPDVKPPIAANSIVPEDSKGRIVINIYEDGTFADVDGRENGKVLANEDEVEDHVANRAQEEKVKGYTPVLHLRGDKDTVFKYSREVMRASAKAGVQQVKFASFQKAR